MGDQMCGEESGTIQSRYTEIPSNHLFSCDPPEILYHYTDYEGAKGILESKSLWLTKQEYLNDTSELGLAIEMFNNIATEILHRLKGEDSRDFLQGAAHQLQNFRNTNICIAAFCENGDLLSQWRSYGNGGSGVSIGFVSSHLKRLLPEGLINLWKCIYDPEQQRSIIMDLIDILLKSYDAASSKRSSSDKWEQTVSDLIDDFNTTFLTVAPVIKSSHFSEEKEWRVVSFSIPVTNPNWSVRISNEKVTQYYRLDLGHHTEFLDDIVIGPTQEPVLISDAFRVFLHKCGYGMKRAGCSNIPFRQRLI